MKNEVLRSTTFSLSTINKEMILILLIYHVKLASTQTYTMVPYEKATPLVQVQWLRLKRFDDILPKH